jgi:hypothetical protein
LKERVLIEKSQPNQSRSVDCVDSYRLDANEPETLIAQVMVYRLPATIKYGPEQEDVKSDSSEIEYIAPRPSPNCEFVQPTCIETVILIELVEEVTLGYPRVTQSATAASTFSSGVMDTTPKMAARIMKRISFFIEARPNSPNIYSSIQALLLLFSQ